MAGGTRLLGLERAQHVCVPLRQLAHNHLRVVGGTGTGSTAREEGAASQAAAARGDCTSIMLLGHLTVQGGGATLKTERKGSTNTPRSYTIQCTLPGPASRPPKPRTSGARGWVEAAQASGRHGAGVGPGCVRVPAAFGGPPPAHAPRRAAPGALASATLTLVAKSEHSGMPSARQEAAVRDGARLCTQGARGHARRRAPNHPTHPPTCSACRQLHEQAGRQQDLPHHS